jgi:alpha-L-fucosidase 2
MKKYSIIILFLLLNNLSFAQSDVEINFDAPATYFTESIPFGNGRWAPWFSEIQIMKELY